MQYSSLSNQNKLKTSGKRWAKCSISVLIILFLLLVIGILAYWLMFVISPRGMIAVSRENLLLNPGAEQGKGDIPSIWYRAAIPAEGLAMFRDDKNARSGACSLAISNTHQYAEAVSNNWAQKITDAPAGKRIQLTAYVKTENADYANVCIQCWGMEDKMVAFASTSVIRGDQDWIRVQSEIITVPPQTAYLCVRAALTGSGKAWFDDILVAVIDTATGAADSNEKPDESR